MNTTIRAKRLLAVVVALGLLSVVSLVNYPARAQAVEPGNVILFHPDGYALAHWDALRILLVGPDGVLNWDRLPYLARFAGHNTDVFTGSSIGTHTTHAYGIRVSGRSIGYYGDQPITALSGKPMSIMEEAIEAGYATALIQTAELTHWGTSAFVASVRDFRDHQEIARQVVESGVAVIFGGGERWLLPTGVTGRHGAGARTDSLNLIERAKELGYTVVYTREELQALPDTATRVLGVFASGHTYNAKSEEELRAEGLPLYVATAPTVAEMSAAALEILSRKGTPIFMMVEEEGTDDFPNRNNAAGSFEAGRRADEAIGVFREFLRQNPRTLLMVMADSSAGDKNLVESRILEGGGRGIGAGVITGAGAANTLGTPLVALFDGVDGPGTAPFVSAPDRQGNTSPFFVTWGILFVDLAGGVVLRAEGLNADRVHQLGGVVDSTNVYRLTYLTLFGRWLE
jgi:alkaline phosphatase